MSANSLPGVTFPNQKVILGQRCVYPPPSFDDGILTGCDLSLIPVRPLTMAFAGGSYICGRQIIQFVGSPELGSN